MRIIFMLAFTLGIILIYMYDQNQTDSQAMSKPVPVTVTENVASAANLVSRK